MKDWFARLRGKIRRSEDHFPKNLKLSDITPVSKKGNKNLARNYRTVSVLSTLSKLFVKIMRKQAWIMLILLSPISFRSSYRRCSMEKGALENFAKFTGKRLRPATLLKKRLWHAQVFSSELCKIFKNTFFIEHLRMTDCFRSVWLQKRAQKYALLSLLETWKKTIDNKYFVEYW